MNQLEQARAYESQLQKSITKEERPAYHASTAAGWLNDPNGFSSYRGEYHLFYQYYPYDTKWGPMHWGHYKSRDMIKWEMLPAALAPDETYETGCFSGSAIETLDGKHLLMYTAHYETPQKTGPAQILETQCIAIGDGVNYVKYENNPVLTAKDLPEGSGIQDFRDPKIWKEQDGYYAVLANRAEDGTGAVRMFTSKDGLHWQFLRTLRENHGKYGKMWECPDFFQIGDKAVLVVSPMNMKREGLEFHPGHGVIAMIGTYDKETHAFTEQLVQAVDYGMDYYAPQSMESPDGRRIQIGWMQSWAATTCHPESMKWFGMMTIPRELTIEEGRLIQNPVRELEAYRSNRVNYEHIIIEEKTQLSKIKGRVLDFTVTYEAEQSADCEEFEIRLAANEELYTSIRYFPKTKIITVNRANSGITFDVVVERSMQVREKNGKVVLRFLLDKWSMELFVNDGEQAFSICLYETPLEAEEIFFSAKGKACIGVEKYELAL